MANESCELSKVRYFPSDEWFTGPKRTMTAWDFARKIESRLQSAINRCEWKGDRYCEVVRLYPDKDESYISRVRHDRTWSAWCVALGEVLYWQAYLVRLASRCPRAFPKHVPDSGVTFVEYSRRHELPVLVGVDY